MDLATSETTTLSQSALDSRVVHVLLPSRNDVQMTLLHDSAGFDRDHR